MTPPISTVADLHPRPVSSADRLLIEQRLWRRQMVRRGLIALLVVAVSALLIGISGPIGNHLQTAWWLERLGLRVHWQIDETNWRAGGVTSVSQVSLRGGSLGADLVDRDLRYFLNLHRVQSLSLAECGVITDNGLATLRGLNLLTELNLARLNQYRYAQFGVNQTRLTDACLVHLRSMPRLENLSLSGNQITDQGLSQIAELTNLKVLDLDATEVSDAGLIHLQGMKSLQSVNLAATRVTIQGLTKLQDARPDLSITIETEPAVEEGVKLRRGATR